VNHIRLENISKKFGRQVIFSAVNLEIIEGEQVAVIGYNGSGKSTLLQIIAGYCTPSGGTVSHFEMDKQLSNDQLYQYISFAAPYLDLIEEYTAAETVKFYSEFKSFSHGILSDELLEIAELSHAHHKPVKFFSSGMKQRLKLILAILSDVPFVFLDEPASNLDKPGIKWYRKIIELYNKKKIIIISSNESADEIDFCNKIVRIEDYKKLVQ
jgi:ABC-type multidrug transport system ATPase subunit